MSNKNLLFEIITDEFFFTQIPLTVVTITRNKGNVTPVIAPPVNIDVIIQSVDSKDLINLGLGIYADKENFSIFTSVVLDMLNASNFVDYYGKRYKVIKRAPWQDHGFIEYVVTQYNEDHLAGNGGAL